MTGVQNAAMAAQLILATGSRSGLAAPLLDGYYLIGRHAECQIRPKSRSVSRRHCLVQNQAGKLRIFDIGSTSGTYVDGQRIVSHRWKSLDHGAQIRCGKICFNVVLTPQHDSDREDTGSLVSGTAFGADDIADFLSSADEEDRQNRYAAIRADEESSDDIFGTGDEAFDVTIFDEAASDAPSSVGASADPSTEPSDDIPISPTVPLSPTSDVAPGTSSAAPETNTTVPGTVDDSLPGSKSNQSPEDSSGRSDKGKPGKPAKAPISIPKVKKKRAAGSRSFRLPISMGVGSGGIKLLGMAAVALITIGFLGHQIYQVAKGPEVRVVRGID